MIENFLIEAKKQTLTAIREFYEKHTQTIENIEFLMS